MAYNQLKNSHGFLALFYVMCIFVQVFAQTSIEADSGFTKRDIPNDIKKSKLESIVKVERDNIAFSSQCDIVNNASSSVDIGMTGEMLFCKGKFFYSNTLSDNTVFEQNRTNNNLQIHAGYKKSYSKAQLKLNSNTGFYYSGKALFFDPGIAINIPISPGNLA